MDTNRRTAVTAGVLFIIATVTSVVGTQLSQPIVSDPGYLTKISASANQVTAGALLELIAAVACAGIALSLYPVLKNHRPGLALGAVVFRTLEAVLYIVGVVSLLALMALSRQFVGSATGDVASYRVSGDLLLAVRQQAIVPAVMAFSLGALMYYYVFYESQLIPRWLSGGGLVAILMAMGACLVAWFTHNPLTTYTIVLLPIAVQEMVLALWLIARGFSSTALRSKNVPRIIPAVAG